MGGVQRSDYASIPKNRNIQMQKQDNRQKSNQATSHGANSKIGQSSNGKKTNFVEVLDIGDDDHAPIASQYFSEEDLDEHA